MDDIIETENDDEKELLRRQSAREFEVKELGKLQYLAL